MPELPEVETVVRELRNEIVLKTIIDYSLFWEKSYVNYTAIPLNNQQIIGIERKGKYIIFHLSKSYLIIHLRMTGKLLYYPEKTSRQKHDRFLLNFMDGSQLVFNDIRKFGRLYHTNQPSEILKKVGIDAMDEKLTAEYFYKMLSVSRRNIKTFLLAQSYISGMGNIYVDEALFRSRISPFTISSNIQRDEAGNLLVVIKEILEFAIKNMGTTISDYRDAFGNFGNNQKFLKVYQRAKLPCYECGDTIKRVIHAGRSTHYCPTCQRIL